MRPRPDVLMWCGLGVKDGLVITTLDAVLAMMPLDGCERSGLMT